MTEVRAKIEVSGRVQGVCYRVYTRKKALQLNLRGWVLNRPDGKVRIEAQGPREKVTELIQWCHQGSPASHVTDVQVCWLEPRAEDESFDIKF